MYHYINFRKTDFKHHMMNQLMIIKCIYINYCYDCECDAVICVLTIFYFVILLKYSIFQRGTTLTLFYNKRVHEFSAHTLG